MERYPSIDRYEWNRKDQTLLVHFYRNTYLALYTPIVHDLKTNQIIRYATTKHAGYRIIPDTRKGKFKDFSIQYENGTLNPFAHPAKVLKTKAYLELPDDVRVYPITQESSLNDQLFQSLVLPK